MTMSLSTGLISGMDTGGLVAQLIQAEAGPQTALKARLKTADNAASAFRTVNTTFLAVSAAAEAALKPESWNPTKATVSGAPGVAVTAKPGSPSGSLTFTVKQLATSHAVMNSNAGVWKLPTSPYGASEIEVLDENDVALTPKIKIGGTQTLADAAAAINASPHGLSASVVQVANGDARLRIASKETGLASKFSISGPGTFATNSEAADAQISIGAVSPVLVSSSTNTFDSVMGGATLTVSKLDETATVTIASDPDAVAAKMQTLVDAVNAAVKTAREYTSNAPGSTATLKGDYSVSSLGGRLLDAMTSPVPGAVIPAPPAAPTSGWPVNLGFTVAKDGQSIAFDKAKFLEALKADPAAAQRMVGKPTDPGADKKLGTADDVAATGIAGKLLAVAKSASDSSTGSLVAMAKGQDSLKKDYQDRIAGWDLRLAKRKETLTRQFTAMETGLSSLRNQSTWLAGQINSLPTG
jgi:flagellar capping protein FliD